MNSVFSVVQGLLSKVAGGGVEEKNSTQSQATAWNMPGGGAAKAMKTMIDYTWKPLKSSPKQPVDTLYTKPKSQEKGSVNASKVASLMAKPNRPKPLKRKSTNKLDKASKKALMASRKEAAQKYMERSAETKKELVYKKNALKRSKAFEKQLKKKQPKTEACYPNIASMIYQVGPQPKYKSISKKFRAFRKFSKTQLKHTLAPLGGPQDEISFIYKVGAPVVAAK